MLYPYKFNNGVWLEILSRYTLIGLTDRMDDTLDKFGKYMGWAGLPKFEECKAKFGKTKINSAAKSYTRIEPNSPEWNHLAKKNEYDLELFRLAEELFDVQ
jgi:hypothetical protein